MADDAHAQASWQAPSFLTNDPLGVTVYYLKVPGSSGAGALVSRFLVIGVNSGPPGGPLDGAPGVVSKTYFHGVPAGSVLPPAPPSIERMLRDAHHALDTYARWYDELSAESVLGLP